MTYNNLRLALAAAAAVGALAAPMLAQAQPYQRYSDDCTDRIHDNGVAGALVGAAAGAVLGSNVASHKNRTEGALIGGAAGAAVGSNIARSSTKDGCRGAAPTRVYVHEAPPPVIVHEVAPPPPPVFVRAAPPPRPVYVVAPPPQPVYVVERDPHHDHGRHRGWYKHHRHDHDDDRD